MNNPEYSFEDCLRLRIVATNKIPARTGTKKQASNILDKVERSIRNLVSDNDVVIKVLNEFKDAGSKVSDFAPSRPYLTSLFLRALPQRLLLYSVNLALNKVDYLTVARKKKQAETCLGATFYTIDYLYGFVFIEQSIQNAENQ